MSLKLDLPVKDFAGINRNLEKISQSVEPSSAEGTVGNSQLQDDAVDARVLRDDAGVNANRAVTRNHIRDQAIDGSKLDPSVPLPKRFAANVGDGVLTSIDVVHNFGTKDVQVQVFDNVTGTTVIEGGAVLTSVTRASANKVTLVFAAAPAAAAYRAVVIA